MTQAAVLLWSASPGPHERHLRRRYRNVLFPQEARCASQPDIDQAQAKDQTLLAELRERLRVTLETVVAGPDSVSLKTATDRMLKLDDLREELIHEGTQALSWIPAIDELETDLAQSIESALGNQFDTVARFRAAEDSRLASRSRLSNPIVIELTRVPAEDVAPTVASADPEDIRICLETLHGTPVEQTLRNEVARILLTAVAKGLPCDRFAEKLAVIRPSSLAELAYHTGDVKLLRSIAENPDFDASVREHASGLMMRPWLPWGATRKFLMLAVILAVLFLSYAFHKPLLLLSLVLAVAFSPRVVAEILFFIGRVKKGRWALVKPEHDIPTPPHELK